MADGAVRVLSMKANYFAEKLGYDVTIIITEGQEKSPFYPLSDKIHIISNLNFLKKRYYNSFIYIKLYYLKNL